MVENGKYYIYRHIRLDKNEVFYIGYGKKNDKNPYKRAKSKFSRNTHWKNIVRNTKYLIEIIIESHDENFILEKEIEFIKLYGRRDLGLGTLCNLTDGGEGTVNPSEETRKKVSERFKNRIITENHRKSISEKNKGKSSWNKGIPISEEARLKSSITRKLKVLNGKWNNPNPKGNKRDKETVRKSADKHKIKVIQLSKDLKEIKIWDSVEDASRELNISSSAIGNCLRKGIKFTSGGFRWKYYE